MRRIRFLVAMALAAMGGPICAQAGDSTSGTSTQPHQAYTASVAGSSVVDSSVVVPASHCSACESTIDDCEAFGCDGPSACACDCCCDSCCAGPVARWLAREPFKLPQPCCLQALGVNTGGWVQAGITANGEDPADGFNGPLLTNDQCGNLEMNQLWLYFERPVDTGGCGFDYGGRVDVLYGSDWRVAYFHGLGLEGDLTGAKLNGSDQLYGLALPQFYAEFGYNDLSVKLGRMTGILGYEIVPPMGNFFYSHSYALCYGEPILITGLMARQKVTDQVTALAGFHEGIHWFEDNNDRVNFQGGLTWTSEEQRLSLAYALDIGRNDFLFPLGDEYVHSVVVKLQVTPKLLYVLQQDYGWAAGLGQFPDAEWYGVNQYLMYTLNDKWSVGARAEWFRDDDGTRVLGLGNLDVRGWSPPSGLPGYAGNFGALTMGLNWKPKANILFRPELRWDWYDGSTNFANTLPFDAGTSDGQFTLATDLVVTF